MKLNHGKFKLTIVELGETPLHVVKVLKDSEIFAGLKETKTFTEQEERILASDDVEELRTLRDKLEEAGAICQISTTYFKEKE